MKHKILKILLIPFILLTTTFLLAVFFKVKSNYSPHYSAKSDQNIKDKATEIVTHLDHMREMINKDYGDKSHMNDIAQMKFALSSRDKICSLDEKDYIKKTDLSEIKSKFDDTYTYFQTDFYFKFQDDLLHMIKVIDIGKKYSEDYPNYVKSNAFKLKNTIDT